MEYLVVVIIGILLGVLGFLIGIIIKLIIDNSSRNKNKPKKGNQSINLGKPVEYEVEEKGTETIIRAKN